MEKWSVLRFYILHFIKFIYILHFFGSFLFMPALILSPGMQFSLCGKPWVVISLAYNNHSFVASLEHFSRASFVIRPLLQFVRPKDRQSATITNIIFIDVEGLCSPLWFSPTVLTDGARRLSAAPTQSNVITETTFCCVLCVYDTSDFACVLGLRHSYAPWSALAFSLQGLLIKQNNMFLPAEDFAVPRNSEVQLQRSNSCPRQRFGIFCKQNMRRPFHN